MILEQTILYISIVDKTICLQAKLKYAIVQVQRSKTNISEGIYTHTYIWLASKKKMSGTSYMICLFREVSRHSLYRSKYIFCNALSLTQITSMHVFHFPDFSSRFHDFEGHLLVELGYRCYIKLIVGTTTTSPMTQK